MFTYCSSGSSHDQHFFREPEKMISGQVEAPRIDLLNEDLLRVPMFTPCGWPKAAWTWASR